MACSKEVVIREDNLWCSICLDIYNRPRTLPCLHSFCHQCLSGYIKQLDNSNTTPGFNCPICRSHILPPVAGARSEKWADQFPVNFTLVSILNSKKDKMATMNDSCEPCVRVNVDTTAIVYCFDCGEKLCEDCRLHHTKSKASYKHNVGYIKGALEDIPKLEVLKELMKCPNHPLEDVKFMCKDHDKLCCGDCAIVGHRKCDHIISVAEMAATYKLGENKTVVKTKLDTFDAFVKSLHSHEVKQSSSIDSSKEMVKQKLAEFRKKLEKTCDDMESKLLQLSNVANDDLAKGITKQENAISEIQVEIVNSKDLLEIASKCGNDIHIFLAGTQLEKESVQLETRLQSLQKGSSSKHVQLVEKMSANAIMDSIKECFDIKMQESNKELPKYPGQRDYTERVPTLESEFKCERDRQITSFVRGCVFVDNETVAVVDDGASAVHLFDIKQHNRVASYICSNQPCSIADIGDSVIAVAQGNILVLKIEHFKISRVKEIQTISQPHGLSYIRDDKHLIASSRDDGSITLFTLDGTLVRTIPVDESTNCHIKSAYGVAVNNKSKVVYVSATTANKVIAIDLKGNVLFTYEHPNMEQPWNVTSDSNENLYICCYESHCIHQVSKTGVFIRQIITSKDGLKNPYSMCFNKTMDTFVLTANDNGKEIKVYDFK